MTKLPLTGLAGAAMLLLLSAQIAAAGPDGTCEEFTAETVASEPAAPSTPTAAADYTKIAQAAPASGNSATVTASVKIDASDKTLAGKKGNVEKKQTESLPKESRSSESAAIVPAHDIGVDGY
jgi:hypothetical protein